MTFQRKALALGLLATLYSASALADHVTLNSGDGYSYYFDPSEGELRDIDKGSLTDPINSVLLYIDGMSFNGSNASAELDGQAQFSGTDTYSGLTVSRQTFASSSENVFRQLSYFENETGSAITANLRIGGTYSGAATDYVTSSDGNDTLDAADVSHTVAYNSGMHVVHVYGSAGAAETVDAVSGSDGVSTFEYEWQGVTVEPGETVILMTFVVGADDSADAEGKTSALSSLTGEALFGIDSDNFSNIVNWNLVDSDGDGIIDVIEDNVGLDKNDPSDANGDLDNDGLSNIDEYELGTDLLNPDSDGDGLSDGEEVNELGTNPLSVDTDGDGLTDDQEVATVNYDPTDNGDGFIHPVTSGNTSENHQPQMAVDSEGRLHVVWLEYSDDSNEFEVRYKLLGTDRSTLIDTVEVTSGSTSYQGHPSIAVDASGKAYLAWFDSSPEDGLIAGIDPSKHALDGSSADMADIKAFTDAAADANGIISGLTDMKRTQTQVDSQGRIHIAYSQNISETGYIVFRANGSVAKAAAQPFSVAGENDYAYSQVRMVLDSDDNAHIVWSENDVVYYGMYDGMDGTVLIDATPLVSSAPGDKEMHVSVSVDDSGTAYVVWGNNDSDDNTILFAALNYADDDQNGDAADLSALDLEIKALQIPNLINPWYIHSGMMPSGNIAITYMTGGGNSLSPVSYVVVDTSGEQVGGAVQIAGRGADNYDSYGNYAFVSDGKIVYATDTEPKNIVIYDASFQFEPVTTQDQLESSLKKALDFGGSSFSFWGWAMLLLPLGLRMSLRRKQQS